MNFDDNDLYPGVQESLRNIRERMSIQDEAKQLAEEINQSRFEFNLLHEARKIVENRCS